MQNNKYERTPIERMRKHDDATLKLVQVKLN